MRRQPPIQTSRPVSGVTPTPVRVVREEADDRAVLLDRAADGAELEIGPIATARGARWTRAEGLMGLGLVAVLFGGALLNSIANPGPKPSPTANAFVPPAQVECQTVTNASRPARARLRVVGDTGSGTAGRTGLTGEQDATAPDDWLLPGRDEGLEIGRGTPLEAVHGDVCVVGWSAWVVPTRNVLVSPRAAMEQVGSATFRATAAPIPVTGPPADGDWTLRLATAYQTDSADTIWSVKFFRLIVGGAPYVTPVRPTPRPTPVPTPAVTPTVACGPLSAADGPPVASLVVPGQDPVVGTNGALTWFGNEIGPSTLTLTEGPSIPFEGALEFRISGDVCATRWSISSMAFPQSESTLTEVAFSSATEWTSFANNRADNPIIAQQNRITATPVGLGRTLVRAILNFEGGNVIQAYWLLRIGAFEVPPISITGPDGTAVTPVMGCGVSVYTNDNYFGEECPPGSWPLLENGPMLTVHDGDFIELDATNWPVTNWYLRWANQADVRANRNEPPEVGSVGGYDSLNRTLIRWFVPPAGDWTVQFILSHEEEGRQYSLPLHIRVRVLP